MSPFFTFFPLFMLICFAPLFQPLAVAQELSGSIGFESRVFFKDALFKDQRRNNVSVVFTPEYYHQMETGSSITITPFFRLDSADSERSHFDVRELNYLWIHNSWELTVGISKVFWGVTEFVHLVDIINQTDIVESIDNEEKLGQPMAHLSIPADWGVLDLFLLPWFRERTFPGRKGRLRLSLVIDTDKTQYESGAEEHHLDAAFRYSHTIGDMDVGVYHFIGTGREPTILPSINSLGDPVLIPLYEQINQSGTDMLLVAGSWLWKMETIYRTGQGEDFFSGVVGYEYTLTNFLSTGIDVGVIGELVYDERGSRATTAFNNDILLGLRLSVNDSASSQLLTGVIYDIENSNQAITVEASRRIGSSWKAELEANIFSNPHQEDVLYSIRNDDFISLEFAYYF